jgi:transposase
MSHTTYSMAMKGNSKENRVRIRRSIVQDAQRLGIKAAAYKYNCSRNTVRKWLRNFEKKGYKGLHDNKHGPKNIPHKTSKKDEEHIIMCRKRSKFLGALRLKYIYDLKSSASAIYRILKENNLIKKRKKKYQKKNDLREVKAKYRAFSYLQYDVKHLYDIPNYWAQYKQHKLPKYQYTIRDVKSGWVVLGFSDELSELNARLLIDLFLTRMKKLLEVSSSSVIVQTDNGSEFSGQARAFDRSSFSKALVESHEITHRYIPPGCSNANADVESFHNTVEVEFFDNEIFSSRTNFFNKINSYQLWYNLERKNYSKKKRTPLEISNIDIENSFKMTSIGVVDLDKISTVEGGQHLPNFPEQII